jgi:hypothetical protein
MACEIWGKRCSEIEIGQATRIRDERFCVEDDLNCDGGESDDHSSIGYRGEDATPHSGKLR